MNELDRKLLGIIRSHGGNPHCRFQFLQASVSDFQRDQVPDRQVDRALQRLRKKGLIAYRRARWFFVRLPDDEGK